MTIRIAQSDEEIMGCFSVMRELRPHLSSDSFISRVRSQERAGYHLAYLADGGKPVAVAGYRILDNLVFGRFLYVDDLVTLSERRSRGHGRKLLNWLGDKAVEGQCQQLVLDSGKQRVDAHRFYQREGFKVFGLHFSKPV